MKPRVKSATDVDPRDDMSPVQMFEHNLVEARQELATYEASKPKVLTEDDVVYTEPLAIEALMQEFKLPRTEQGFTLAYAAANFYERGYAEAEPLVSLLQPFACSWCGKFHRSRLCDRRSAQYQAERASEKESVG